MPTFYIFHFIIGLILGSFANVCICRMPRDESVVMPRSRCPACKKPIRWYDNIPLFSFIMLRGKCRHCESRISLQYPIVELITGVSFVLLAIHFDISFALILFSFLTLILIIISGIDFHCQIIPDQLSYLLVAAGILTSFLNPELGIEWKTRLMNSCAGTLLGSGILLAVLFLGKIYAKKEAMGVGDVKLIAGIGAFLGFRGALATIILASILGSIAGLILIMNKKIEKRDYIPFGPFLGLSAFVNILISEYFSTFFW
ncbi:MAG: prepilin peptidase [Elusimicrobiota bacterium]